MKMDYLPSFPFFFRFDIPVDGYKVWVGIQFISVYHSEPVTKLASVVAELSNSFFS